KHYKQKVTHGKLTPEKERNIGRICSVEWCDEKHHANGYCSKHDAQMKTKGKILEIEVKKTCKIEGCNGKHKAKGLCKIHYHRMKHQEYKETRSTIK
ncbi:hypothetical protein ACQUY5_30870, partial [Bacillus cereus]